MKLEPLAVSAALLIALAAAPAPRAEEFAEKIPDLVWVDVGGTINELATSVALTGPSGAGATIDFEDIFDLPGSKTTFAVRGTVRVSEHRRHVDFGYVNIDRSGSRELREDLSWGDYVVKASGLVTAQFNTRFIYGAFRYDFLHEPKVRISGSAGASYVDLGTNLSWSGDYVPPGGDPNAPITGDGEKNASVGLPVPLLGFNVDWALTKGLVFSSYNRFFRLNTSGIKGGMYENGVHLNWYFIRNLGIGVGFDRTQVKLDEYESGDNKLKADYVVSGIGLYATMAF